MLLDRAIRAYRQEAAVAFAEVEERDYAEANVKRDVSRSAVSSIFCSASTGARRPGGHRVETATNIVCEPSDRAASRDLRSEPALGLTLHGT